MLSAHEQPFTSGLHDLGLVVLLNHGQLSY